MNTKQPEEMTDAEAAVWDMLQTARGEQSAISRDALAAAINVTDRSLREIIASLITRWGCMIISNYRVGGYYLPANEEERERYVKHLHNHALSILLREAAIKKLALRELLAEYQMSLDLEEVSA